MRQIYLTYSRYPGCSKSTMEVNWTIHVLCALMLATEPLVFQLRERNSHKGTLLSTVSPHLR